MNENHAFITNWPNSKWKCLRYNETNSPLFSMSDSQRERLLLLKNILDRCLIVKGNLDIIGRDRLILCSQVEVCVSFAREMRKYKQNFRVNWRKRNASTVRRRQDFPFSVMYLLCLGLCFHSYRVVWAYDCVFLQKYLLCFKFCFDLRFTFLWTNIKHLYSPQIGKVPNFSSLTRMRERWKKKDLLNALKALLSLFYSPPLSSWCMHYTHENFEDELERITGLFHSPG